MDRNCQSSTYLKRTSNFSSTRHQRNSPPSAPIKVCIATPVNLLVLLVFQKTMDIILQGIPKTCCYIHDILLTGQNDSQHLQHLRKVFQHLEEYGLCLKRAKCEFMKDSVECLGYHIDSQEIHTISSKVDAIAQAPQPPKPSTAQIFLGLVNYYGKFVPNLATLVHPLNRLLHKEAKWNWDTACHDALSAAKQALTSSHVLVHYDPNLPITLATNASAYGVGAVISHMLQHGSEHPIALASRTLSTSERNYTQIEKEALSITSESKSSTHTSMEGSLHLPPSLALKLAYHPLLLHVFNVGQFFCQLIITTSNIR